MARFNDSGNNSLVPQGRSGIGRYMEEDKNKFPFEAFQASKDATIDPRTITLIDSWNMAIAGDLAVAGDFDVAGDTTVVDVTASGDISCDNLDVTTDVTVGGNVDVTGSVTAALLSATNIIAAPYIFHAVHKETANTNSGAASSGSWVTRTLNQVWTNTISGASLSSSQVTLPAGTYYLDGYSGTFNDNRGKIKWYNVTDTSDEIIGHGVYSNTYASGTAIIRGVFTITSSKVFELQGRIETGVGLRAWGVESNFGVDEIYGDVFIIKLA